MIRALAGLVKTQDPPVSRHDFYVPLCDLLSDIAERDPADQHALRLLQIAHSFGHDLLNLATLAGRLLWCEGVTPDMSRSPDLVSIGVDTETYLVSLRAACDTLTGAVVHFGVEPRHRGQIPSESFNGLRNWIKQDPARLNRFHGPFHFIAQNLDWFTDLRGIRDKIVHQGYHCNIYTDRVLLELILMPIGEVELQMLHGGYKEKAPTGDRPRFRREPLLMLLKKFTVSILELANQLAHAIEEQHQLQCSRTHTLNGVYVPALPHLLAYAEPLPRHRRAPEEERRSLIVAWHLLHAGDYLRASERGYLDGFWWRFLIHMSELFSEPPRLVTEPHFSDDGSLVDWRLVFCKDGENVVFAQRDMILLEPDWLQANKANLTEFASEAGAQRAVLVANRSGPINATMTDVGLPDNLIVDSDPDRAAERAYHALFPRHEAPEP